MSENLRGRKRFDSHCDHPWPSGILVWISNVAFTTHHGLFESIVNWRKRAAALFVMVAKRFLRSFNEATPLFFLTYMSNTNILANQTQTVSSAAWKCSISQPVMACITGRHEQTDCGSLSHSHGQECTVLSQNVPSIHVHFVSQKPSAGIVH